MDEVTRAAFEALPFVRGMVRMCGDGWAQGWHERNGGNASYRLTEDEAARARALLAEGPGAQGPRACAPGAWEPLGAEAPELAGALFLVTAAGSFMRNVADDPSRALGVVEVDAAGSAWRALGGFAGGGRPTSELAGHLLIHEARLRAWRGDGAGNGAGNGASAARVRGASADAAAAGMPGASDAAAAADGVGEGGGASGAACGRGGEPRVLYHAHPVPVIALAKVLPPDARVLTRVLWRAMTECVMVFPEGVGCVGLEVPGSLELARASAEQARRHAAVIWAHHGLLSTGATFDDAFGLMHAIVKAAEIHNAARMMASGCGAAGEGAEAAERGGACASGRDGAGEGAAPKAAGGFAYDLTDADLQVLARGLGVTLAEDFIG